MEDNANYFLKVSSVGASPILEITKIDFEQILEAKRILTEALAIEEKYDLALSNFLDFEKELLSLTADYMISVDLDYNRNYKVRSTLNRKFINFLISGKMYTEQIATHTSRCTSTPEKTFEAIKEITNQKYDSCLDYRMMEALRNHVSHSGFAAHTVSIPSRWTIDDANNANELVFSLNVFAEKKVLSENKKFSRTLLNMLPERFDLKKAARSYIGAISSIQSQVRNITNSTIEDSRHTIEKHLESYARINKGDSFAVGAHEVKHDSKNKINTKPALLFLQWDDVRVNLSKKNTSISNMNKRYVTNAISPQKK